jgi:hypothetical protein
MFAAEVDGPLEQRLMVRWPRAATAVIAGYEFGRAGLVRAALDQVADRMHREVEVGGNLVDVLTLVVTTQDGLAERNSKGPWHGDPPE